MKRRRRIPRLARARWRHDRRLAAQYGPVLRRLAMSLAKHLDEVVAEVMAASRISKAEMALTKASSPEDEAKRLVEERERLLADIRDRIGAVVEEHWSPKAVAVVSSLYGEGYVTQVYLQDRTAVLQARWRLQDWPEVVDVLQADEHGYGGLGKLLADADVTIKSIGDTMIERLADELMRSIDAGEPYHRTARSIRGLLSDPERAEMIAITEVGRAMEASNYDTARRSKSSRKRWLTALDEAVCATICGPNADADWIGIEEEFPSGDMTPPGHPWCRCVADYDDVGEQDDEDEKRKDGDELIEEGLDLDYDGELDPDDIDIDATVDDDIDLDPADEADFDDGGDIGEDDDH